MRDARDQPPAGVEGELGAPTAGPSFELHGPLPFRLPFDPGSSPLALRTAWCIERMVRRDLSVDMARSHLRQSDTWSAGSLVAAAYRLGAPLSAVASYEEISRTIGQCDAIDDQGRPRRVRVVITRDAPQLVRSFMAMHAPPPGVTVRAATASDGPAVRRLELRTPVVADGVVIAIDRGDEPLAATRLMDDVMTFVAEYGGEIVAVQCDAYVRARIGGVERQLVCRRYLRIDPEHRGLKLFPALNFAAGTAFYGRPGEDGVNEQTLVRAGNARAIGLFDPMGSFAWSTPVEMCILDCAKIAGPSAGRPASPADAAHIAALSNAAHRDEQLYVPYEDAALAARLERAPDLYSWPDTLVDDDAVLGVWNQRFQVRHGDDEPRVQAVVLDSGFVPGVGEAALERLIRASCRRLLATGTTHLVGFTSTLSPDRDLLVGLGATVVQFVHSCRVPEPQPATGIRFDPIYF